MGVSGQLYHLPVPSGTDSEPIAVDVDLRDGPTSDMWNTSATTSAGKVVGNGTEPIDVELHGLKLMAGSPIFSWASIVTDLKGSATSKTRYANF